MSSAPPRERRSSGSRGTCGRAPSRTGTPATATSARGRSSCAGPRACAGPTGSASSGSRPSSSPSSRARSTRCRAGAPSADRRAERGAGAGAPSADRRAERGGRRGRAAVVRPAEAPFRLQHFCPLAEPRSIIAPSMRARLPLITALLVGLLLAGAGAVYGYDRSRADLIADGVRIGGIDVGGLTPAQARVKLRRAVLDPLNRPVRVRAVGERFRLTPARARIAVDLDGSVAAALGRSRRGNMLGRTVRALSGGTVSADVPLDVHYSHRAVRQLVKRVGAAGDRDAVDASVDLEHASGTPTPSHEGRKLPARRLARDVRLQLLNTGARTLVRAHTRVGKPAVTVSDLEQKYPAVILVNRSAFQLTLYENLKPVKTYGIAVGQVGLETPAGLYNVENKAVDPDWHVPNSAWAGDLAGTVVPGTDPSNPIKARWMGIYAGAGIHGTDAIDSIGTAASHGCIRMTIPDVVELYDQVPVGAPVYIS